MKTRRRGPCPLRLATAALVLASAGCWGETIVDPVHEIPPEEALLVVPFREPHLPERWDSQLGNELARDTTTILTREAEFQVRPYEDVLSLYQADDIAKLSFGQIAALCRAEWLLICDIVKFDLKDPKSINLQQAEATVKVRLFQVDPPGRKRDARETERSRSQREAREGLGMSTLVDERGGRFVREDTVEAKFPTDFHSQYGQLFMEPAEMERGLAGVIARKVSKLYYPHPEEKVPRE